MDLDDLRNCLSQAVPSALLLTPLQPTCARIYCDSFNLDAHITGQASDLNSGTGRGIGWEELAVGLIHAGKVIHILEKDGCLYQIGQRETGAFQNRS